MIVVAIDAHDARAVDAVFRIFGGLEIGGNEDAGVKALLCGLGGHGVGEIAGGGAAHGSEVEAARGGKRGGDDAIFKGERREADGIIFEIEIFQAPFRGEFA